MTKLYLQSVRKSIQFIDEGRFNKENTIVAQIHLIQMCATALRKQIPNKKLIDDFYFLWRNGRKIGDGAKAQRYYTQLQIEIYKDEYLIKEFENLYKNVNVDDNIREEVWTKDSIGILSHEEEL